MPTVKLVYFAKLQPDGSEHILPAPDTKHPTPAGYERRECHHLYEVDKITKLLIAQDKKFFERMLANERAAGANFRAGIRSRLRQRKLAIDCKPIERDFIDGALRYLDQKEQELYKLHVTGHFHQREYDGAGGEEDHGLQLEKTMPKRDLAHRLPNSISHRT
jgi:hypothetical protein